MNGTIATATGALLCVILSARPAAAQSAMEFRTADASGQHQVRLTLTSGAQAWLHLWTALDAHGNSILNLPVPTLSHHAATKGYVDSALASLDAASITSGILAPARLAGLYPGVTGLGPQSQTLNMSSNRISGLGAPLATTDAATRGYVDSALIAAARWASIADAGGTVQFSASGADTFRVVAGPGLAATFNATTHAITYSLASGAVTSAHIADGTIVDADISATASIAAGKIAEVWVNAAGDTMSGNLTMTGGARVTGLPAPIAPGDAATRAYVDASIPTLASWYQRNTADVALNDATWTTVVTLTVVGHGRPLLIIGQVSTNCPAATATTTPTVPDFWLDPSAGAGAAAGGGDPVVRIMMDGVDTQARGRGVGGATVLHHEANLPAGTHTVCLQAMMCPGQPQETVGPNRAQLLFFEM